MDIDKKEIKGINHDQQHSLKKKSEHGMEHKRVKSFASSITWMDKFKNLNAYSGRSRGKRLSVATGILIVSGYLLFYC